MPNLIVKTVATSSAHGISRAAATHSRPLRIGWIILFLSFLGLLCNNGITLLDRLINIRIVTVREDNKVLFQFPDLYFCPSKTISGSYPLALNASEAALINNEMERLGRLYDRMMLKAPSRQSLKLKAKIVLWSMSRQARNLLFQRREQSVLSDLLPSSQAQVTTVLLEHNTLCFKYSVNESVLRSTPSSAVNLRIDLFTDPYNSHFSYSGSQLKPIVNHWTNKSAGPQLWDFQSGLRDRMSDYGYSLIPVGRGHVPTLRTKKFNLAPGRSYVIALSMEKVEFDEELHNKNCSTSQRRIAFVDPIDGSRVDYKYSYFAFLFETHMKKLHKLRDYVLSSSSIPWDLRGVPGSHNLTESHRINASKPWERWANESIFNLVSIDETKLYLTLQACVYYSYNAARLTSRKWPEFSGSYAEALKELVGKGFKPALEQLVSLAEELDSGNHTAHAEALFRQFVSDSMLRVTVRIDKPKSPRLLIANSYSLTQFLADFGGLLGLYIGCSCLTVCEILELVYHLVRSATVGRSGARKSGRADQELEPVAAELLPAGGTVDVSLLKADGEDSR